VVRGTPPGVEGVLVPEAILLVALEYVGLVVHVVRATGPPLRLDKVEGSLNVRWLLRLLRLLWLCLLIHIYENATKATGTKVAM